MHNAANEHLIEVFAFTDKFKSFLFSAKILLHSKLHIALFQEERNMKSLPAYMFICNALVSMEIQIDSAPSQVLIKGLF